MQLYPAKNIPEKRDFPLKNTSESRIELSTHSNYDSMDSVIKIQELIAFAKEHNMPAIALTDTNSIKGFPEFEKESEKFGIKPIYGISLIYINHNNLKNECPNLITILVKNQVGLKNLYRIISEIKANKRCAYVLLNFLIEHHEGLLYGSCGHEGVIFKSFYQKNEPNKEILKIFDYYEIENFYQNKSEQQANKAILQLGKQLNKPVVAVSNARYLDKKDSICFDILNGRTKKWYRRSENLYLRNCDEIYNEFSYLSAKKDLNDVVLYNPLIISQQIEKVTIIPKKSSATVYKHAYNEIEKVCWTFAKEKYGEPIPTPIKERLEDELKLVKQNGYYDNYLLAKRLIQHTKSKNDLCYSHIFCALPLLSFFLEITKINPLKPHYYCGRCKKILWVNTVNSGFDLPDKVCSCGNVMRGDGQNIPFETLSALPNNTPPQFTIKFNEKNILNAVSWLKENFQNENRLLWAGGEKTLADSIVDRLIKRYENKNRIFFSNKDKRKILNQISGVVVSEIIHPCGVMVLPEGKELLDITPSSSKTNFGIPVSHYNWYYFKESISNCNILNTTLLFFELEKSTGVKVNSLFPTRTELLSCLNGCINAGDLNGIVVFENHKRLAHQLLSIVKPQNFSEIVKLYGFIHGAQISEGLNDFFIANGITSLADIPTCEEDIYLDMISHGIDKKTALSFFKFVRKQPKQKSLMQAETIEFKKMCQNAGLPNWYFEYCTKIKYLCPKVTAIEQAYNAAVKAWYKVHFPNQFHEAYEIYY